MCSELFYQYDSKFKKNNKNIFQRVKYTKISSVTSRCRAKIGEEIRWPTGNSITYITFPTCRQWCSLLISFRQVFFVFITEYVPFKYWGPRSYRVKKKLESSLIKITIGLETTLTSSKSDRDLMRFTSKIRNLL